ncbi:mitochondrial fission ELM1 family protein [Shinella yambaruensis]|uniref:Nucleoside-diphosphate sugar epimerase n=1 Tax=Shinella yambaruensis TaxID=415996 RepID=A0ABQ5ZND6_9HYPH|nr:mitochondrial fission ELM1 family protein [Shinella yambaruensis]MCJ8025540.1 mitochondrial fission ELM1 family protein [Shinella yambaruensis]MCU7979720.1 mitochondrial fission ELM1 family protein [Shinella yambaruensis]GLR53180.1 nucleoside-diphosphate sugar epimerase [Shinella yambaruensis]
MAKGAPPVVWVLTDGKAGDEQPLIGLAEAMGSVPVLRRVAPRRAFTWLMPWGPIDPKDAPAKSGSPLAPPFPDICLATGRRAVPYLRRLKALAPATFCVLFKDPRTRRHGADLLIVQQHDAPRGANVLVVTTAPNRLSPERLADAHAAFAEALAPLPRPRVAVLVGGDSRHHRFTDADNDRFLRGLEARLEDGCGLMITTSRRTPAPLANALSGLGNRPQVRFWDGTGENPLLAYLSWADEIVVTADSTNMVGEAAALSVPVQIFHPSGGHAKIDRLIAALSQEAVIGRFPEEPAHGHAKPVNSTPGLAEEILKRWRAS